VLQAFFQWWIDADLKDSRWSSSISRVAAQLLELGFAVDTMRDAGKITFKV